jgi:hypothetical protein
LAFQHDIRESVVPELDGAPGSAAQGKPHNALRRVAIVDNDEVTLLGTLAVLRRVPDVRVVLASGHDRALGWDAEWAGVDVAVIDACDTRREGDQFPGVAVVEAARKRASKSLVVVVVTGQWLHPGLRRRMWEAGADFFCPRPEGMSARELADVVLRPEEHRRLPEAAPTMAPELGVRPNTAVNEVVEVLRTSRGDAALAAQTRKKSDPHGSRSRWWGSLRALAAGPRGLVPVTADGCATGQLTAPSVPQLRKFWQATTQVHGGER